MTKRLISLLLAVLLVFTLALPAAAEEETKVNLKIRTVSQLLTFAEHCRLDSYSAGLVVSLEKDLDVSGADFESIPIFCGTFLGNNHTIRGLHLEKEGSVQGLFRYLTETAVVEKLTVQGDISPEGSRSTVGGIAGENAGTIRNCSFIGTVSGGECVGGITGRNTVTGILENCRSAGEIHGNHFVGGIAGENAGVIRNSDNTAQINTTAKQNSVSLSDITIGSLTNTESSNTVTDIGGIAGASSGVVRSCNNWGDVGYRHMGYNIGGIAGTQSGYLASCVNHGEIQGRKEVGGIAGQMEPAARIEYEEDAIDILQRQLEAMGRTVNSAVNNARTGANQLTGSVYAMQDHVWSAMDALDSLRPSGTASPEGGLPNIELPDADAIQAAKNGVSNSLSNMTSALWGISETTQSTMGALSNDMYALKDQLDAMRTTLGNVSSTLGGSIADVSDADTPEDLTGKVEHCVNYGDILADINAGGIAGAMAMENDLDPEDDWHITGENSLNFESELRAVVLDCENQGIVTVKKQNGGGIVGWQSMGLVKNSSNTGTLDSENADYIGGVSGRSSGFIRDSYAKCRILGHNYVGGIAGSATIATNCRSMVLLSAANEKLGEVLGMAEETDREEEAPVSGNFYLAVERDDGGIDGISYSGKAESLAPEKFLMLDSLPQMFRQVTVTFRYPDGLNRKVSLEPGGTLKPGSIPILPEKKGMVGQWEGLAEADLADITFDMTVEAVYYSYHSVIQSEAARKGGLPVLLVEGTFTDQAEVILTEGETAPDLETGLTLVESWAITLTEPEQVTMGHCLVPEGLAGEDVRVLLCGWDGQWTRAEAAMDGSYLVFPMDGSVTGMALVQEPGGNGLWLLAAAAAAVAALAFFWYQKKRNANK